MRTAITKQMAIAATGLALAVSAPVGAADMPMTYPGAHSQFAPRDAVFELKAEHNRKHKRKHRHYGDYDHGDRYYGDRYDGDRYYARYDEPVYRDTRIWRGRDGRYYCRRENGTTGLLIGAGVGGLIGNEVSGRGDKALGTLLGAVGGALLGREIDRSNSRCR